MNYPDVTPFNGLCLGACLLSLPASAGPTAIPTPDLSTVQGIDAYVAAAPKQTKKTTRVEKIERDEGECEGGGWSLEQWPMTENQTLPPSQVRFSSWPSCGDGEWSILQTLHKGKVVYSEYVAPPYSRGDGSESTSPAQVWLDPQGQVLQLLAGPTHAIATLPPRDLRAWIESHCGKGHCTQ
jgi:hypothetical protein